MLTLLRYAAGWLLAAGLTVAVVGTLMGSAGDDEVSLPPVVETELDEAARSAGCEVRRARAGEALNPPVDGRSSGRIRPGVYERPLPADTLGTAARQGIVLIHHAAALGREATEQLRRLQGIIPRGTIVTVNGTGMRYEVAVTAYRRLLGCLRFTPRSVDAIRLFRGRYIGTGPDR